MTYNETIKQQKQQNQRQRQATQLAKETRGKTELKEEDICCHESTEDTCVVKQT